MACRESSEPAQLDPSALGELVGDGIKNGAHHAFNLPLREVGKVGAKLLHQFGTDHHYPAMENRPLPSWGPFTLRCQETLCRARWIYLRGYGGAPKKEHPRLKPIFSTSWSLSWPWFPGPP